MVTTERVKVADQVWIAVALLHREQPDREGFSAAEIVDKVRQEFGPVRPAIRVHISLHCVASKPPNPGRYRMLHSVRKGRWRLFRDGDAYHPDREGGKVRPEPGQVPERYRDLLEWYNRQFLPGPGHEHPLRALLKLAGLGSSGRSDISERHDDYLAEAEMERWRA